MEVFRWVSIALAVFVVALAVLDLPGFVLDESPAEAMEECLVDEGAKVAEQPGDLGFARADGRSGRLVEVGGTSIGDGEQMALRFLPSAGGSAAYEVIVVAERPLRAFTNPGTVREVVEHPDRFDLVAYFRPAKDARNGSEFWRCAREVPGERPVVPG